MFSNCSIGLKYGDKKLLLNNRYINTLEKYIGKKIAFTHVENGIRFCSDSEVQYQLIERSSQTYEFQTLRRGQVARTVEYKSHQEMQRRFAITLKGLLGGEIDYSGADKIKAIGNDFAKLNNIMALLVGAEFYSINDPSVMKVNLESTENDKKFSIYILLNSDQKIVIEEAIENPFAFLRFYNEALFLKERMRRIQDYEKLFNDYMTESEIDEIMKK